MGIDTDFWKDRKVFITGHTGFKGSWLSFWLARMGARVHGFALEPPTDPSLFEQLNLANDLDHQTGDIRDRNDLAEAVQRTAPDVVFHLAAQPLVRASHKEPVETYATNLMGTVHLLDALRTLEAPCAAVLITTDKVYENLEREHPYKETDRLGGKDPYSNSKACCELAIQSYRDTFFPENHPVKIATARAGNVIGGGDWAEDRLLPDIIHAVKEKNALEIRYPDATRPWQHVLDPLAGYLMLAEGLSAGTPGLGQGWNFGPDADSNKPVKDVIREVFRTWGNEVEITSPEAEQPREAGLLNLDSSRAKEKLGWAPRLPFANAISWTVDWHKFAENDPRTFTASQIDAYQALTSASSGPSGA